MPKALIGQWQNELLNLFGIQAKESHTDFIAPGVYLVGREFAGNEGGAESLGAAPPFDLVIIDEAHEIFAGSARDPADRAHAPGALEQGGASAPCCSERVGSRGARCED